MTIQLMTHFNSQSAAEEARMVMIESMIATFGMEAVMAALSELSGNIAVLGAGGKMGFHLCRLLQRGLQDSGNRFQVIAVSRFTDPDVRQHFESHQISVVAADLSNAEQYSRLPSASNVFFLAGIKFGTSGQQDLLHRMNVTMPNTPPSA